MWEIKIQRDGEQRRGKRWRTVGTYQIYHEGKPTVYKGWTAESRGPGNNEQFRSGKCIAPGRYQLWTHAGQRYATYCKPKQKPAVLVYGTGNRRSILIHPGHGFLASVGCINLTGELRGPEQDIDEKDSWQRVFFMIQDMKQNVVDFPDRNGVKISEAFLEISV